MAQPPVPTGHYCYLVCSVSVTVCSGLYIPRVVVGGARCAGPAVLQLPQLGEGLSGESAGPTGAQLGQQTTHLRQRRPAHGTRAASSDRQAGQTETEVTDVVRRSRYW